MLPGEIPHGLDLRVEVGPPLLPHLGVDVRVTGLDGRGDRQEERLDEDQFRARLGGRARSPEAGCQ
ncbi:hypothetical protein IPZ68_20180 [Streptomyces arenae]|nr:hypothetical protein [Streptomyces arenae]